MTVGRSGSTSLTEALAEINEVALPSRNIVCEDEELVHPARIDGFMQEYSKLAGKPVKTPTELIEAFYALNEAAPYAGFKSMPNRHPDWAAFTTRKDIQFITLRRRDIPSTA